MTLTGCLMDKGMQAGKVSILGLIEGRLSEGINSLQQVKVNDVSFWQDDNSTPQKINFSRMRQAGTRGVFLRAGQNSWPDPDFEDYARDARAAGVLRGAYWFYDSRQSPIVQANLYHSIVADQGLEMEIVADYEESYGGPYGGTGNLGQFMQRLMELGVPESKLMVYTGYYYWNAHSAQSRDWFARFPLWLAWYTNNPLNVKSPAPWGDALYWQWSSSGDGPLHGVESKEIDMNWFRGDLAAFNTRYGVSQPPGRVKLFDIDVFSDGTLEVNGTKYAK